MSKTYKHQNQRDLKERLKTRKQELGDTAFGVAVGTSMADSEIRNICHDFWSGSIRYGNKRHYESYMKWKQRKAERYKNRQIDYE